MYVTCKDDLPSLRERTRRVRLRLTRPAAPGDVTSAPRVRYPYPGRSRVAQSAERPAVNRQVPSSSLGAGATKTVTVSPPACEGRASGSRPVLANGTGRAATRGGGEVIELEYGITVYPAREEPGRWRAVWYEEGKRQQCEVASEEKLTARLEKVTERLQADAPNMKRPGAELIAHYLNPDRLPVDKRWSLWPATTRTLACAPAIELLKQGAMKFVAP